MIQFDLIGWLTRRRSNLTPKVKLALQCTACRHKFDHKARRLYIDLNTFDQRQLLGPRPKRSEFVVPERITCPKCGEVDRYRVTGENYHLITKTPLVVMDGMADPSRPIQCIRFTLRDGQAMHPIDALAHYALQVKKEPTDVALRAEYANTLRMLGNHREAEAQYRIVLHQDPIEPNALLNLALFHDKRQEREQAAAYLTTLADTPEPYIHSKFALFADAAAQILEGVIKPSEIELTAPRLFDVPGSARTTKPRKRPEIE